MTTTIQRHSVLLIILLIIFWTGFGLVANAGPAELKKQESVSAVEVLELAEDVGRWLASHATTTPAGTTWPDNVLDPTAVGYDLASGIAGKVLYFTALYRATGNGDYLQLAEGGADYLLGVVQNPALFDENPRRASLYTGISGIGVALLHVQEHLPDPRYGQAVVQITERLREWSVVEGKGLRWSDEFNDLIYGDAGTALFLAYVAEQTGDENARDMAQQGARFLLGQAQQTQQGSFWYFRRSKPFNLPNFSHGTAGVAYVLATISTLTDDESLREGAQAGFDYIRSIAVMEDGRIRIPYGWGSESWDGLYEFGWAHGLAGTASFFRQLQVSDIDVNTAAEYENLSVHTLLNINLPGTPLVPFAEPSTSDDMRFGRAGVLSLLSQCCASESGEEDIVKVRTAIWSHIDEAAVREDRMAHWEVDAPAFMGGGRAAYTGMFHGAAGIGLAVLHLHARLEEKQAYLNLPHDPFVWPAN
jgi:lantibiotic modifying enzyme